MLLDPKQALEALNQCLEAVMSWLRPNKWKHNLDKLEVVLVASTLVLGRSYTSMLDGVALFSQPVHSLTRSPVPRAALASSPYCQRLFLERDLVTVIHALVMSRLVTAVPSTADL